MTWFHLHRYDVVDVQHVRQSPGAFAVPETKTNVLERCRCGDRRVLHLTGKWSRDQVNGHAECVALELPERAA